MPLPRLAWFTAGMETKRMAETQSSGLLPGIPELNRSWRFITRNRAAKEFLKGILFRPFPLLFKKWDAYRKWKDARVFAGPGQELSPGNSLRRRFFRSYRLKFPGEGLKHPCITGESKLAVAVHVYYPDIFWEILQLLEVHTPGQFKLYITTTEELTESIRQMLADSHFDYFLLPVQNRGRDVLPFLKVLPFIFRDGYELLLKIHTKGSNHLNKKELWKDDLFGKLIGKAALQNNLEVLARNPEIGMLVPVGHILPMWIYYGANAGRVHTLCDAMGLGKKQLESLHFAGGTMFFARKEALQPVLKLGLTEQDFEPEGSQLDGTLAHAMERVFGAAVLASGLHLADTDSSPEKPCCHVTVNHSFSL